jgi:tape measure domain-containing protein
VSQQDVLLNISASIALLESKLDEAESQIDALLARVKAKPVVLGNLQLSGANLKELNAEIQQSVKAVGKTAKASIQVEIDDSNLQKEAKQQSQALQKELKPRATVTVAVDSKSLDKSKRDIQQVVQKTTATSTTKVTPQGSGNPILNRAIKDLATVAAVVDAVSSRAIKARSAISSEPRQQVARIIRNEPRRDGLGGAGVDLAKDYLQGKGVELKQTNTRKLRTEIADLVSDSKKISQDVVNGLATHLVKNSAASEGASEVARDIISTLKRELKISSPSKITEGIGRDIVRGLTRGQAEESASAIKQARQVSNFLIAEYQRIKKAQTSLFAGGALAKASSSALSGYGERAPGRLLSPGGGGQGNPQDTRVFQTVVKDWFKGLLNGIDQKKLLGQSQPNWTRQNTGVDFVNVVDLGNGGRQGGGNGGNRGGGGGGQKMLPMPPFQGAENGKWFASFATAEGLINKNNAAVSKLNNSFSLLNNTVSQAQVNTHLVNTRIALAGVATAYKKGEVAASDFADAQKGLALQQSSLEAQPAVLQNLIKNYKELGLHSESYVQVLRQQEALMSSIAVHDFKADNPNAVNKVSNPVSLSPQQQLQASRIANLKGYERANAAVLEAQGNSGFGGFRGREIGNDEIEKLSKSLKLENSISAIRSERGAIAGRKVGNAFATPEDARVHAALTKELNNSNRALRVLNGTAKEGEVSAHLFRNAWGVLSDDFANLLPQLVVFGVAYGVVVQGLSRAPGAIIGAAASFDKLETSVSSYLAATRNIGDASAQLNELKRIGLDLGIGFEKAAQSYLRMAAATQGTTLEGQEIGITETLATSGRNLGLSGAEIDRASTALTQIASKGTVQMEELKGQLAEALPGAIQVSARAFNVTTKELYGMIEAGQIASDEFISKFIGQLEAEGGNVNQLSGTFANVSEQLGASFQALGAATAAPILAPLTMGMQALNFVIQKITPAMPIITAGLLMLGKSALNAQLALQGTSIAREMNGMKSALMVRAGIMSGFTSEMDKGRKAAQLFVGSLKAIGKAALFGIAIEGISLGIRGLRGEIGSLKKELDVLKGLNSAGNKPGGSLNPFEKVTASFNLGKRFDQMETSRRTGAMAGELSNTNDKLRSPAFMTKVKQQAAELKNIDKNLEAERTNEWKLQQDKKSVAYKKTVDKIIALTAERNQKIKDMEISPQEAQQSLSAIQTGIKEAEANRDLYTQIGDDRLASVQTKRLEKLQKERAEFEKLIASAGLLDKSFKINNLGALSAQAKLFQENLNKPDVNSADFLIQQRKVVGADKAVQDMGLMPEEMALKTQELTMQKMTQQLKLQENITQAKLALMDNERKKLEAVLELERTRGSLREATAQRRVSIAGVAGIPEEQLAAQAALQRVQTANRISDLSGQQALLSKDRERATIETELEKQKITLQKQQLDISKQQLAIERIKIAAAMETFGISNNLKNEYKKQLEAIDATLSATDSLIGNQSSLNGLLDQSLAAQNESLGLRAQSLELQKAEVNYNAETEKQVRQIQSAHNDINRKATDATARASNALAVAQEQQDNLQQQFDSVKSIVDLQKERAQITQEGLSSELQLADKLLDTYNSRNEGGVFERMAKASAIGARSQQDMISVAEQRMRLQRQLEAEQSRQKQIDLEIKKRELQIEMAIFKIKMAGARLANEQAKIEARKNLEMQYVNVSTLSKTPERDNTLTALAGKINQLGGFNTAGVGSSVNTGALSAINSADQAINTGQSIDIQEAQSGQLFSLRNENLNLQQSSMQKTQALSDELFNQDAAAWFGQFIDKTTELGVVMNTAAQGISGFRADLAQAFTDSIMKGEDFSEAAGNAATALSSKIMTSIADQMIFKPMEEAFFKQMSKLGILKEEMDPQRQIQQNTLSLVSSTDKVGAIAEAGFKSLESAILNADKKVGDASGLVSKPSTATPTYSGGSFETSQLVSQGTYQGTVATVGGGAVAKPRQSWQKHEITPEIRAALNTVMYAEGTWRGGSEDGYRTMFGGGLAPDLKKHPDKVVHSSNGYSSAAAGAYQFMPFTWNPIKDKLGLPDFSKEAQDQGGVELLKRRGVLDKIKAGKFDADVMNKMAPEWASFPTHSGQSYHKQPVKSQSELMRFYNQNLRSLQANPQSAGVVAGGSSMSNVNQAIRNSNIDFGDPVLKAIANSAPVKGAVGGCVKNVFDHLTTVSRQYVGKVAKQIENPGAAYSLRDGNDPRAAVIDLLKDHDWTSLPGLGTPTKLSNEKGSASVNMMDLSTYQDAVKKGMIPSGSLMYSTQHNNPNAPSPSGVSSSGYDFAVVRNQGRNIDNGFSEGQTPYGPNTKHVAILVPKSSVGAGMGTSGSTLASAMPGPQVTTTTQTYPGLTVPGLNTFGSTSTPATQQPLIAPTGGATPVVVTNMPPPSPTASNPLQGNPQSLAVSPELGFQGTTQSLLPPGLGSNLSAAFTGFESSLNLSADSFAQLPNFISQLGISIPSFDQSAVDAAFALGDMSQKASATSFEKLNGAISGVVGVIGNITMLMSGIGKMKEGGTQNTLLGLGSIFMSAGGLLTGPMFGGGGGGGGLLGGLFGRESGGPAYAKTPIIVGEGGPELYVPGSHGSIISNPNTEKMLGSASMADPVSTTKNLYSENSRYLEHLKDANSNRQMSDLMKSAGSTEIRYNRVGSGDLPFITEEDAREMARQAASDGAKMGQQRTLSALRNNPAARRGIGI